MTSSQLTKAVVENFRCFGRGSNPVPGNPLCEAAKNDPPTFAAGVDVMEVVIFILDRAGIRRN